MSRNENRYDAGGHRFTCITAGQIISQMWSIRIPETQPLMFRWHFQRSFRRCEMDGPCLRFKAMEGGQRSEMA